MPTKCFRCERQFGKWEKMVAHYKLNPDHFPTEKEKEELHLVQCRYCPAWLRPSGVGPHEKKRHLEVYVPREVKIFYGPRKVKKPSRKAAVKTRKVKIKAQPRKRRGFGVITASLKERKHKDVQERLKAQVKQGRSKFPVPTDPARASRAGEIEIIISNLLARRQRLDAAIEVLQEEALKRRGEE